MDHPLRAPLGYYSDVDGSRHAVIDASLADLAGWRLETLTGDGKTETSAFERGHWHRSDSWIALAEWGESPVALISPEGRRIPFAVPRTADHEIPRSDQDTGTDDTPVVPADQVAAFLARHRPPECRDIEFQVPPHEQTGQRRHHAVLRTLFAELLDLWPAGSTLVVDYGHEYAQAVAYAPALLTEIGPVTEAQLHRAVELGWMNPAHTPRDHPDFESSPLWIGNPVREWTYPLDTIPEIAQFVATSVGEVYRTDPAAGYTVTMFNNHPDPGPAPAMS